jgi:hypothetical protein
LREIHITVTESYHVSITVRKSGGAPSNMTLTTWGKGIKIDRSYLKEP